MSSVFAVLLLVAIVGLLWGLVALQHLAKTARVNRTVTRKHAGLVFGLSIVALFVLIGTTAPPRQPAKLHKAALTETPSYTPTQTQNDNVTTKEITTTEPVVFKTVNQNDDGLPKGQTLTLQAGKNGSESLTWLVMYTNGQETDKTLEKTTVSSQPINQIVDVGTYVAPAPAPTPTYSTPTPKPSSKPAPAPKPGCHPLTNGGNCYEPGEFCRDSDHGASGVAGDGKSIVCADNNGWRWEPI